MTLKQILLLIIVLLSALAQTAFLNPSYIGLNIILALILALALTQKITIVLPTAWIAGLIIDLNKTTPFGISGMVFITLVILITFGHRFFLSRRQNRNVVILGAVAVIMNRTLYILFSNLVAFFGGKVYESLGNYFMTYGFLLEIIITPLLILGLFKLLFNGLDKNGKETIRFSNRT